MRNRGFTLLELLIVIAILGILAALALPSYRVFLQKARRAEAFTVLHAVHYAQMSHFTLTEKFLHGTPVEVHGQFGWGAFSQTSAGYFFLDYVALSSDPRFRNQGYLAGLQGQLDTDPVHDWLAILYDASGTVPSSLYPFGVPVVVLDDIAL